MANTPHVAAAFLCERILHEKDEVLSAIRIVDRYFYRTPTDLPPNVKPHIGINALISFKRAGDGTGPEKHQGVLVLTAPSGKELTAPDRPKFDFEFSEGQATGANLIVSLNVQASEFGLFWIDVLVDGERVTRIPFTLVEQSEPTKTVQ